MDDPRAGRVARALAPRPGEVRVARQQPRRQRPRAVARARVNDDAGRFVHHDEIGVLVDDTEGHAAGCGRFELRYPVLRPELEFEARPGAHAHVARRDDPALVPHLPGSDELRDSTPRPPRDRGDRAVDPFAAECRGHPHFGHRSSPGAPRCPAPCVPV